jgi:hypothetical protein
MALTFPFLCSFTARQAERRFLTWLFTCLVLDGYAEWPSRGKERGEGFFQALQKSDDAWDALSPIRSASLLKRSGHSSVRVV